MRGEALEHRGAAPVDVGRVFRVFVLGYAPSGSARASVFFSDQAVLVGDPGSKVSAGNCDIASIAATCSAAAFTNEGFPVGGSS